MKDDVFSISEEEVAEKKIRFIVKGRISTAEVEIFSRKLDDALKRNYADIIVNLEKVPFLSSGGIRVLLMFYKIANGRGGSFFIEDPSDNVRNVLGMVALNELLLK